MEWKQLRLDVHLSPGFVSTVGYQLVRKCPTSRLLRKALKGIHEGCLYVFLCWLTNLDFLY